MQETPIGSSIRGEYKTLPVGDRPISTEPCFVVNIDLCLRVSIDTALQLDGSTISLYSENYSMDTPWPNWKLTLAQQLVWYNNVFPLTVLTCLCRLFCPTSMATGPSPTISRCQNSRKFRRLLHRIMPRNCSQSMYR